MSASTINQKIWNMATVLYNDGVSNSDYLEQLTYLLFLKMADEYSKPPPTTGRPVFRRTVVGSALRTRAALSCSTPIRRCSTS